MTVDGRGDTPRHDEPVETLLEAYALGELDAADRARVDDAIASDPTLAATLAQIRTTVDAGRVPVPALSVAYRRDRARRLSEVFAECREAKAGPIELVVAFTSYLRDRFVHSPRFRFAAVCAVLQLAVIGLLLAWGGSKPRSPKATSRDWPTPVVDARGDRRLHEPDDDLGGAERDLPRRPIVVDPERGERRDAEPRFGPVFTRAALVSTRFEPSTRMRTAKRWGGGDRTEAAVARGLAHLVGAQADDGRFTFGTDRLDPIGETALGVLGFLAADIDDARRPVIERGVRFLLAHQRPSGFIGLAEDATDRRAVLGHALAAQCLAEARALVPGAVGDGVAARAIAWLAPDRLDDPVTVTQAGITLMVAASLGFPVPRAADSHCRSWFVERSRDGLDAFERVAFAAGDVLARRGDAAAVSVAALSTLDVGASDPVAMLYAAQALRLLGERSSWDAFNRAMVARLLPEQRPDGRFVRAAAPGADETAMAVLMLQTYYRFGA